MLLSKQSDRKQGKRVGHCIFLSFSKETEKERKKFDLDPSFIHATSFFFLVSLHRQSVCMQSQSIRNNSHENFELPNFDIRLFSE